MEEIEIIPLEKVNGFALGISRQEIINKYGKTSSFFYNNGIWTDYYLNDCINLHYNNNQLIEYIEVNNPEGTNVRFTIFGFDIFKTEAEELIKLVEEKSKASFNEENPEVPYSFIFPDLELSFYREVIPESNEDQEGRHFNTVGIGIKGYYSEGY